MRSMSQLGNDLYTGKTSFPFVGRRRLWFIIAALLVIGSALVPLFRPIQFSIEFTGGSQFAFVGVVAAGGVAAAPSGRGSFTPAGRPATSRTEPEAPRHCGSAVC